MRQSYERKITDKYTCKKCRHNEMYPHEENGFVKGFKCAICRQINYPTRDKVRKGFVFSR